MKMSMRSFIAALLLCVSAAVSAAPKQSVVQAEYAFGRAVKQQGLRDGFLAFMDENAIAFVPQPESAKTFYSSRPAGPSTLTWYPAMARLAASGDFGFTTGPWQVSFTDRNGMPQTVHGDYATIWHRTADGTWRWLLDAGVAHPASAEHAAALPDSADSKSYELAPAKRYRIVKDSTLTDLDVKFTDLATHRGMRALYQTLGAKDMRVLQFDAQPLNGRAAVVKATPADKAELKWIASGSGIASSGDLAYTYGMAYHAQGDLGHLPQTVYLHIWQREAHGWKLLLDLENALPPPRGIRH
jgi:ketosteroid isomerase-like protein